MYNFDMVIDRSQSDSVKWRTYPPDVLPLWVADMDFQAPPPVLDTLRSLNDLGIYGYGSAKGEQALLEAWQEELAGKFCWEVKQEELMVLPGVVAGANLCCRALAIPGQHALVPSPVYGPLLTAPRYGQLECIPVQLKENLVQGSALDLDALEAAVTPMTRLLILCNPHNPVGRVYTAEELQALAEFCQRHDLLIISDEIHCDFIYEGYQHIPIACLSQEIANRTVTLMAPSKTYNIPGLQSSVAIVPNADIYAKLRDATCGLVHGIAPVAKAATVAAFRYGKPWLRELITYLEGNRDFIAAAVRSRFPKMRMCIPEGTYLAWLDCREANLPVPVHTFFLDHARVALSAGNGFGAGNEAFARINFGCPRSILEEALERMASAWTARTIG